MMILRHLRRQIRRIRDRNAPDPYFPRLTRGRAGQLRSEMRRALGEHGATVRFDGEFAVIEHPTRGRVTVNLENLIGDVSESQHPQAPRGMAREFIDTVIADGLLGRSGQDLDTASLYAGLHLRIVPGSHVVPEESDILEAATLHGFTADTSVALVLDTERSIQTMPLDRLREVDDLDTLVRAGRNNLRRELRSAEIHHHFHPGSENHPGSRFRSLESGSYYLASAPLLLDEMLDLWMPDLDRSRGVLFAMPTRHILLLRDVTSGQDLIEGIGRMAPVAAQIALDGTNAVSPLLHLWHEGEVSTLSSFDEESSTLTITPTPYLLQLLATEEGRGPEEE